MEELALHILDLVQNSLAAGARRIGIVVEQDTVTGALVVEITDDGRGMDEATSASVFDPFFTSRTTRRVGLGLPMLQATAESTGGSVVLETAVGKGTRVRAVLNAAHVDCPPLGDMATTVAITVAGNPKVDLFYSHAVDERRFRFDTADLRAKLGEVPLSDPAVYQWMMGFLREELKKLHGGARTNEVS